METNVTIRVARAADVEALVRLVVAFRDFLQQMTPTDGEFRVSLAKLLQDAGTEFFLASDDQGTSLGYVQCRYRYSAWHAGLEAELEDVFVVREARRGGVGRKLLEFAIRRARERGCQAMGLNTNERNEGALALYNKIGFQCERSRWDGGRQLWLDRSLEEI